MTHGAFACLPRVTCPSPMHSMHGDDQRWAQDFRPHADMLLCLRSLQSYYIGWLFFPVLSLLIPWVCFLAVVFPLPMASLSLLHYCGLV